MNEEHAAAAVDDAAADVLVVGADGLGRTIEGEAVLGELRGVDPHLILAFESAPRIHLGHALHLPHLRSNDPVVNGAQVRGVVPFARHDVVEDFAEARGDRPHFGPLLALRQSHRTQPLVHELPGEINVRSVFKNHNDLGEAELRDRPQLRDLGYAVEGLFDGECDLLFDFGGAERGHDGVDLNLNWRGVGERIHVEVAQGDNAGRRQRD